jgi:regulator of sigma E protease
MEILVKAGQLILSLSILIVLHELGHFIPARLFKTKVEKFYLFFDPWFSLFKVKKGETEYGIGWLPLGGYVKISGMVDESMDKEQMKQPPKPWEFRSKPAWQRLIIMIGGVTVNLILGVLIYWMVLFAWGKETLPLSSVKYGIACDSLAYDMGLKDGDKILTVDNKPVESFNRIPVAIILDKATSIQVDRDGKKIDIPVKEEHLSRMITAQKAGFIYPRFPTIIDTLIPGRAAEKAGLKKGDQVVAVNGVKTPFFNDVQREIRKHSRENIQVTVVRGNDTISKTVPVTSDKAIGFGPVTDMEKFFDVKKVEYSFFGALPAGIQEGYEKIIMQFKQFKVIFTVKDAHKSVGGFMSIGNAFSAQWDWQSFWYLTAFLSIVLAVMNILPIPALDGGHVMFLLYEVITRRKPSEKFLEYAQYAGMLLLLALLLYANGNDIFKAVTGK